MDAQSILSSELTHNWVQVYSELTRPELGRLLQILKLDLCYHTAQGNYLKANLHGREVSILDFLGGYGSTILGHSNKKIQNVIQEFITLNKPVHAQASIRTVSAQLSLYLNQLLNKKLNTQKDYISTFLSTGTEATEAALKHCLLEWAYKKESLLAQLERKKNTLLQSGQKNPLIDKIDLLYQNIEQTQPTIFAFEGSFHGKTAGSLSATHNQKYKNMYSSVVVKTTYLQRSISTQEMSEQFQNCEIIPVDIGFEEFRFTSCAGVFIELIQGEGGIHVLNQEMVTHLSNTCKLHKVPLIVDEIQTGLYRTGRLLACENFGIVPDYLLLGKSLGGGYAKIGAFITSRDHYIEDFGMLHTSTFSEDDFSSQVALATLQELESMKLFESAKIFELQIKTAIQQIQKKYPGVIHQVRGTGWMLGIEFSHDTTAVPPLLESIQKSGYSTYIFASYLLHKHGIRVAATLNQNHTLRIEPSCLITEDEVHRLCDALADLALQLYEGKLGVILEKVLNLNPNESNLVKNQISVQPIKLSRTQNIPVVTFMTHLIDFNSVKNFDPALSQLPSENLKYFMDEIGPLGGAVTYHEQIIEGLNGEKIHFQLNGITVSTSFFENSLRAGNQAGYLKVKDAVLNSISEGSKYIGLGQFTSIASDNGIAFLNEKRAIVTTGNSLTAGISYRELLRALSLKGKDLADCKVGIVGAAGNICNVYAQIIADKAQSMVLIHREPLDVSPKFAQAIKNILMNSKIDKKNILATHELKYLSDCDIIVSGTNSSQQILLPEYFKDDAIILDIAVPSNIHPSIIGNRNIEYIQGGYVQLPFEQKVIHPVCPAPNGEIFACMAETITLGLMKYDRHFSMGGLKKEQIQTILDWADTVGMNLGSQKTKSVFK